MQFVLYYLHFVLELSYIMKQNNIGMFTTPYTLSCQSIH